MKFVSRSEWGARPPNGSYSTIHAASTTGHWEGPHMGSFPHDACAGKVRGIQAYHMDNNGWTDIAYNAVACPHGYVYEGRGRGHRSAANGDSASNDASYAVCFLGGEGDVFTDDAKTAMVDAADWLGQRLTYGHRDWYNTACPGNEIYNWIHAGAHVPAPAPEPEPEPPEDEDDMNYTICAADGDPQQYVTDMVSFKRPLVSENDWNKTLWCLRASGAKVFEEGINTPFRVPRETIDGIPTVNAYE